MKSLALFLLPLVAGQCLNNGFQQSNGTCSCPVGFGGADCALAGCGGTLFQGSGRSLAQNVTENQCQCQNGWGGTGCNVCTSNDACTQAYTNVGGSLVCNTEPKVYSSNQLSCAVVNPTLQAIYPRPAFLNIIRTINPDLSPLPNVTSFGASGTALASLFYDGVEQFYCSADSCTQTLPDAGGSNWKCANLKCSCIRGKGMCGGSNALDLTGIINGLSGDLGIECKDRTCNFIQETLNSVFGQRGLALDGCTYGECITQAVKDGTAQSAAEDQERRSLSSGVIAGLAVIGGLLLVAFAFLFWGCVGQRRARRAPLLLHPDENTARPGIVWDRISYTVSSGASRRKRLATDDTEGLGGASQDKTILDDISGSVKSGEMVAILGPSGAGKTSLIEILAGKAKSGSVTGTFSYPYSSGNGDTTAPRISFVPQQDILPATLTVFEALLFAARLRLPESIPDSDKIIRVNALLVLLGLEKVKDTRIGSSDAVGSGPSTITKLFKGKKAGGGSGGRGISGGEMRRVSIGLELISEPDILILDEPTSGLDSVNAARVVRVLRDISRGVTATDDGQKKKTGKTTAVIFTIHQPSSRIYHLFTGVILLSFGRTLYSGAGGAEPINFLESAGYGLPHPVEEDESDLEDHQTRGSGRAAGYNPADYLLEVASDPPVGVFSAFKDYQVKRNAQPSGSPTPNRETTYPPAPHSPSVNEKGSVGSGTTHTTANGTPTQGAYPTTFLTQLEVLSGREWKILRRDMTLFYTHLAVSAVLGVFCGGLYYQTGIDIAGFQSRVGCLFFLGALIAFSALSALYNVVQLRPLFVRERSSGYYSPTAWLISRFLFDVIPLRLIPGIVVSTITYWMAGLAPNAANFFKFLLIIVLFTLAMTLFNFLLGAFFQNGGIAILLSALTALYQMTFAGFFVHLDAIPPVLRWLQWLCPLKYCLEALSVNEVHSGLMIQDNLEGVPVNVSAALIMNLLFGFGSNNYYRDVLILFGFIAGFAVGVIAVVWFKVRERR